MRLFSFLMLMCGISSICFADDSNKYLSCFIKASQYYKVPQEILTAIASVESNFNPNAYNENSNHSYDIGLMQINSTWLPKLAELNITEDMLYDPCQSIYVGAWILSNNIKTYGLNWNAVQRYNGNDVELRYATKVYDRINKLFVDSQAKLIPVSQQVVLKNDIPQKNTSVPVKNNQQQVDEILAKSGIKSLPNTQITTKPVDEKSLQDIDTILAKSGIVVSSKPQKLVNNSFKQFFTQNQPKTLNEFIQNTLVHIAKQNDSKQNKAEVAVEPCTLCDQILNNHYVFSFTNINKYFQPGSITINNSFPKHIKRVTHKVHHNKSAAMLII